MLLVDIGTQTGFSPNEFRLALERGLLAEGACLEDLRRIGWSRASEESGVVRCVAVVISIVGFVCPASP